MLSTFQQFSGGPVKPNTLRGEMGLLKLDEFSLAIYLKNKELQPRVDTDELAEESINEARKLLEGLGYAVYEGQLDEEEDPDESELDRTLRLAAADDLRDSTLEDLKDDE
jgi:hypothetical protein